MILSSTLAATQVEAWLKGLLVLLALAVPTVDHTNT